jgi:hypothetical protein
VRGRQRLPDHPGWRWKVACSSPDLEALSRHPTDASGGTAFDSASAADALPRERLSGSGISSAPVAGWVIIEPEKEWKAAGWLFRWVVSALATNVEDAELRRRLDEIVNENLPTLDLAAFTAAERDQLRSVIRDRLVEEAETRLPADVVVDRDLAINYVRDLAGLVSAG